MPAGRSTNSAKSISRARRTALPQFRTAPITMRYHWLIQSYVAAGTGGWWPDERDPGVRGKCRIQCAISERLEDFN